MSRGNARQSKYGGSPKNIDFVKKQYYMPLDNNSQYVKKLFTGSLKQLKGKLYDDA
jgi:hypothetical protein